MNQTKTIALTYGDSKGIGVEILEHIIENNYLENYAKKYNCNFVLFGSSKHLSINLEKYSDYLELQDTSKQMNYASGEYKVQEFSFYTLKKAIEKCLTNQYHALVTGPINKAKWAEYEHNYTGQTELLGDITNTSPQMLFIANPQLRKDIEYNWNTLLLTRHIPLKKVSENLTLETFVNAINTLKEYLNKYNNIQNPTFALAGLNPHMGDNGLIGDEELQWKEWIEKGLLPAKIDILSPDEIWYKAVSIYQKTQKQPYHAYLAPYHDMALPLIKTITNLEAVNVSIGLPFLRTSPDHGTGYDIVGKGLANPKPFLNAILIALNH